MKKDFDLIVVGAGPAGAMAARTASETGLKVALLERKRDITTIRRACATMLVLESDFFCGERMYFNQKTKRSNNMLFLLTKPTITPRSEFSFPINY